MAETDTKTAGAKGADKEKTAAVQNAADQAKDQAELDALNDQIDAENHAQGLPSDSRTPHVRRAEVIRRIQARDKAARDALATEEVTVARGRTVFTEAGQTVPHKPGAVIKVTPEEALKLRQAGAIVTSDGAQMQDIGGPKTYQERGLLEGHAPGQGQEASKSK